VARTPEAAALTFEGSTLTYRELDLRANRLAHHLRSLGVGVEDRVGLCLERSHAMVVALLAVLKAGGAYVPLDPAYPQDRLDFMVRDARLAALVTEEGLRRVLDPGDASVILVDAGGHLPEGTWPETSPGGGAGPNHLAYVIYTSGSTGRPRGSWSRTPPWPTSWPPCGTPWGSPAPTPCWRSPRSASTSPALELLLPLAVGGRVELAGRAAAGDGVALAALLESSAATLLQATPATWRMLLEAGWGGRPGWRCSAAARPCPATWPTASWPPAAAAAAGRLWNLYGPTEATVWATRAVGPGPGPVDVGRPIAGLRAYVLDARLRPAPVGSPASCTWGAPGWRGATWGGRGLTAERFVPDPFGPPGGRLYRTGDRGRWLAGGRLECLGRADGQVKVRGHRVELGEVEAALGRHPAVRRAAARAWEDGMGGRRLVGYVVPEPGSGGGSGAEALRAHLRGALPEYMVPSAFVALPPCR
jgi:amino acid adenylation domain-containing protein